jgi:hypothetical protein
MAKRRAKKKNEVVMLRKIGSSLKPDSFLISPINTIKYHKIPSIRRRQVRKSKSTESGGFASFLRLSNGNWWYGMVKWGLQIEWLRYSYRVDLSCSSA